MVVFSGGLAFEANNSAAKPTKPVCVSLKLNSAPAPPPLLSVDWRKKGAVTGVKDQATSTSRWAFAAAGAVEGAYFLATGKLVSISAQELVDCEPNYKGCDNEGYVHQAFDYTMMNGLVAEQRYPYINQKGTCQKPARAPRVKIDGYAHVSRNEKALEIAVAKQPVAAKICSKCPGFKEYSSGVLSRICGENKLDHDVLVVGYGTVRTSREQYWIVKNSWGEEWGDKGYVKLRRGDGAENGGIVTELFYPFINHKKMYEEMNSGSISTFK